MIKIDYDKSKIAPKFHAKLDAKTKELSKKRSKNGRKKYLSKNNTWRELSEQLSLLSNGKCWYTEVYEIGSYFHVDHYRPKNGVRLHNDVPASIQNITIPVTLSEEGYWWDAYNWENYRLASARTNSGSKSNCFPIYVGSAFWDNRANPNSEVPLLLDPLLQSDCDLLIIDNKGRVEANPLVATTPLQKAKVEASKKILALNDGAFVNARQIAWKFTDEIALLANDIQTQLVAGGHTPKITQLLRKTKNILSDILKSRIAPTAEFSKTNYFCLLALSIPWINNEVLGLP